MTRTSGLGDNVFERLVSLVEVAPGQFTAPRAPERDGRTYGGQFLAQALSAGQLTVGDDRDVHSLHAYFLRPGNVDSIAELDVETVRDGRSFSSRSVCIRQLDNELFRMMISFHVPEPSDLFASHKMPKVPAPEEVTFTYNDFIRGQKSVSERNSSRPIDVRYINPPTLSPGEPVFEDQLMWMRLAGRLSDDWALHYAGLAYLSDSTLIDNVVLPHGRRWDDPGLVGVSLDHSMWFHERARADEWLLFHQTVEATGDNRGLAVGRFFNEGGALVATCVQEGMVRWT
jgi:acyl-CoA thioesterase-2